MCGVDEGLFEPSLEARHRSVLLNLPLCVEILYPDAEFAYATECALCAGSVALVGYDV